MNPPTELDSPSNSASDTLSDAPSNTPVEIMDAAEAELSAQTPATKPLKRGDTPFFVPVVLPELTPEVSVESASEALAEPENAPLAATEAPPVAIPAAPPPEPENAELQIVFSPPPEAAHSASVTLRLSCAAPGAVIRTALDAEEVDENGALYDPSAPLFLTQSTKVAARAWQNGTRGPLAIARFEIAKPQWQKVEPTDQSDATTHEISDEAALEGPWRLAAASVRGKLHAHRGGWREDAYRHGLAHASDGTYSVVVVSDGAGSAPLSRVASNLLCQTALDFLVDALEKSAPLSTELELFKSRDLPLLRGFLVDAARLALQTLREEATRRNRPLSDFAATFLVLVRREWNGAQLCAALQAGDGGIALWNEDGTLTMLGEADHGAQSGETRFLISSGMEAELPARVKFSIRPNLHATAVMTDGVADDYFPEPERFPDLFKTVLPLVEGPNALSPGAALLDWIDYEKKGSADDRALVICWRAPLSNAEISTPDGNVSTSNIEVSTRNVEVSTSNLEVPTSNLEVSSPNVEVSTENPEVSTRNVEVATSNADSEDVVTPDLTAPEHNHGA